jgi:5-methylcytosine-specific restriction protein A
VTDQRSAAAAAYRRMYFTPEWRRIRSRQLKAEQWCRLCASAGKQTKATVCDHITPHKGNPASFYGGPFQSLCAACHDSAKKRIEHRGFDAAVDSSGWPVDPMHPANRVGGLRYKA